MTATATFALPEEDTVLDQARHENFPVALRVLPRREREHLTALYGYARLVDDVGDELAGGPAKRLEALDELEAELDRAVAGTATHPVFVRLATTISSCELDRRPFADLIEANRIDQSVTRYAAFDDLLGYCRLSADPVGRLVLAVFGEAGDELSRLSDLVCSALQIIEHLQDVGEDAAAGRIYLPTEDLVRFSVDPQLLLSRSSTPDACRRLVAFEASRARRMLDEGSRLVALLQRRSAALAIAGFTGGGYAQLDALAAASFDVLSQQVKAGKAPVLRHTGRLVATRRWRQR
jgi:squalene synthase HpnC